MMITIFYLYFSMNVSMLSRTHLKSKLCVTASKSYRSSNKVGLSNLSIIDLSPRAQVL